MSQPYDKLGVLLGQGCVRRRILFIGAAPDGSMRRTHVVGETLVRPNTCIGAAEGFPPYNNDNMVLRRRLIGALARHTRPNLTRGQRLWSVRCRPQNSINATTYRYLGSAGHATLAGPDNSPSIMSPRDTAVAQADQTPQPGNGEEDSTPACDEDSQPLMVETWHEAVDAVLEATRAAFPKSPAFNAASPEAFQSYWRSVFARLHERVASDKGIPEQLTSPPSTTFWVNLFAQGPEAEPACPCCLPDVEPSVRLEKDARLTKGDLVAGLGRFLYGGERPPRVYVEDPERDDVVPEENEAQRPGVLIHGADWMSEGGGGDDKGRRYVYTGGWIGRPAMIWMYCSQWGEFKVRTATDPKNGAGGKDESGVTAKL